MFGVKIPGGEELFVSDAFEYYNEELTDPRYCNNSIWWCGCDQPHVISIDDDETASKIHSEMMEAFEKGGLIPVQEIGRFMF